MIQTPETDMSTACCATTIPLHRPWWQRAGDTWRDWWAERRRREAERALFLELGRLSEQTLRDIGAPAGAHERDRGAELWRLERHPW